MATLVKPTKEKNRKSKREQKSSPKEEDYDKLSTSSVIIAEKEVISNIVAKEEEHKRVGSESLLEELQHPASSSFDAPIVSHDKLSTSSVIIAEKEVISNIVSEKEEHKRVGSESLLEELQHTASNSLDAPIVSHECSVAGSAPSAPPAPAQNFTPLINIVSRPLLQYPNLISLQNVAKEITEDMKSPTISSKSSIPLQRSGKSGFALAHSNFKPLTAEQLKEIYYCAEKDLAKQFELEFLMNSLLDSTESDLLYKAVLEYYNLQKKLSSNLHDVQKFRQACLNTQQAIWKREPVTRTFSGTCGDGNILHETISYERIVVDHIQLEAATVALTALYNLVSDTYSTNLIFAKIIKVKVDHLINELCCPSFDVPNDVTLIIQLSPDMLKCVSQLRRAISILFCFVRKPSPNVQFDSDLKVWLRQLISLQLRLATKEDHWFLLFNILRCPSGVGEWAAEFLQLPGMESPTTQVNELPLQITSPELNHFMAVLQILLLPIKKRNEYLKSYAQEHRNLSDSPAVEDRWIVVDSDGEDTLTPTGECVGLKENDLIALLNQLPFEKLFTSVMGIEKFLDDYIIEPDMVTAQKMLTVVAFFAQLIETLGEGLLTYNNERYKQLAKRLSRLVRHTLQYVYDYHELFMNSSVSKPPQLQERIEVEMNVLLIRACSYIYRTRNLATWQYFSTLPYTTLDCEAVWHIFYYLNVGFPIDLTTQLIDNPMECYEAEDFWSKFNLTNTDVAPEDMYYLLQAFFEMANERDWSKDSGLIKAICLHIFKIGFINKTTREFCYKAARDMLVNITLAYEELLSCLLLQLKHCFTEVERANYLFKSLPLENWRPNIESFDVLSNWLLHYDYKSPENMLARLIISHLNWSFDIDGRLFLPHNIHVRMACLIVDALSKHAPELIGTSGISESVRQVSALIDFSQSSKEQFTGWCWSMCSILRLHLMDQSVESVKCTLQNPSEPLVYMRSLERIETINQAVKEQNPIALFVAMLVSLHGHAIPVICQHGFGFLQQLLNDHRHAAAIRCLQLIVPLFLETPDTLANCESFQKLLLSLLNADKTYLKLAKDMVYASSVGPVLELLENMLHCQIIYYTSYGLCSPLNLINVWLNCFIALPSWSANTHVLYLLDKLLRIAYQFTDCRVQAIEFFYNYFKDCTDWKIQQKTSTLKSLFVSQTISRIPAITPDHCWLHLVLLEIEFRLHDIRYWAELLRQLAASEGSNRLDTALKKTLSLVKVPSFSAQHLVIYKYANLIANMSIEHSLFPIINQKFFELYLWRVPLEFQEDNLYTNYGVADKFYEYNVPLMKRLKAQLKAAEIYHANEATRRAQDDASSHFHRSCSKLMKTYSLWLEDTNINKYAKDTEEVPSQYDSEKLLELLSGHVSHWTEYLNPSVIRKEQRFLAEQWTRKWCRSSEKQSLRGPLPPKPRHTPKQRLKNHLTSYDKRVYAASYNRPELFQNRPIDKTTVSELHRRVQTLNSTANKFHYKKSELNSLNRNYLDMVPQLYEMVPYSEVRGKACDSLLFNRKCTKPAQITVKPEHIRQVAQISRKIEVYSERHDKIVEELLQLNVDDFAKAIQELSGCISLLLQTPSNDLTTNIAIDFFYHVVQNLNDVTMKFQSTYDFYIQLLEELGTFIKRNQTTQGLPILKLALQRPDLLEVLAGVFLPCTTTAEHFLEMYQFLIDSHLKRCDPKILFVLLSKFDLISWLETFQPKLGEINQLLLLVLQGLESWSQPDSSLLQDQFRRQLVHIYVFDFPQHYGEVTQLVLDRISDQKLMPLVLLDLLNALLGRSNCTSLTLETNESDISELALDFARRQKLFTLKAGTETCALLARHFQKERLHHGLHGLYPKHKDYCKPLSMWFACFGHVVLAAAICTHQELLADQISDIVFGSLIEMYAPWLIAYTDQTATQQAAVANWIRQLTTQGKMLLPWSEAHASTCKVIIRSFINIMHYVLEYLPASHKILEHVFAWYVHHFAVPNMPGHILSPIHEGLAQLPWERFCPQNIHIQMLYDSLRKYVPESHAMLGHIFIRVDWNNWFAQISHQSAIVSNLFCIFVKIAFEPNIHIHPNTSKILEEAINYPWYLVEYSALELLLKWFTATVEPAIVLKLPSESNYADRAVLDLLRLSCGMMPERASSMKSISQASSKRMLYTRSFVRMQRACSKHKKLLATKEGERAFKDAFLGLLQCIDKSLAVSQDHQQQTPEEQRREALNLMLEIVAPTQTQSEEISNLHIDSLVHWQQQCEPGNLVMCSALAAIGRLNTFITCIYKLLESSIECYFRTSQESSNQHTPTWQALFHELQLSLPRLELMPIMHGGYFFSLHVFLLYKLEEVQNIGEKITFLQDIIQLAESLKSTPTTEPRLALVWGLIIARSSQLLTVSEHVKKPLYMLARYLQLASTKAEGWGDGLLGVIGLRSEVISNSRKVLTRCLACIIYSLFPASKELRLPCEEYESGIRELSMLLANKKFNDMKTQIVRAVNLLNEHKFPELRSVPHLICRLIDIFYKMSYLTSIPEVWDFDFQLKAT